MKIENVRLLPVRLDLFDGGTGAGAAGGEGQAAAPGPDRTGQEPEQAQDQAGKQGQAEQEQTGPGPTPEQRRKAFRELVSGEYKDLYDEAVQGAAREGERRIRELRERLERTQPVLELLAQRYQLESGDPDRILRAVEQDDSYWLQAAEKAGMSVEQYRSMLRLRRENARLLRDQENRLGQERAGRQFARWDQEARQAKQLYPELDLAAEVKDPQFLGMLRAGVPVQLAYEVIHMEDIKADAARRAGKQVADNIRARGSRPRENGTTGQSGFTSRTDVSRLTPKEMEELKRRALRGEIITLK